MVDGNKPLRTSLNCSDVFFGHAPGNLRKRIDVQSNVVSFRRREKLVRRKQLYGMIPERHTKEVALGNSSERKINDCVISDPKPLSVVSGTAKAPANFENATAQQTRLIDGVYEKA
jgi:hypothetical protein